MLVGAISISSFFSFWKLDYFSDMNCLKNPLSDMISCSSSTQLITSDIRVRYWPRIYSLNIKSIPIGEIPTTKGFPICALNNLRSHCTKIIVARLLKLRISVLMTQHDTWTLSPNVLEQGLLRLIPAERFIL